jgi:hypothetical protein
MDDTDADADDDQCRFCFDNYAVISNPLISPCICKGSIKYIHLKCLFKWIYNTPEQPREQCNMCHGFYTYTINTLEETSTSFDTLIYYNTSTPLAALWLFPINAISNITYIPFSQLCIAVHATTCAYYLANIVLQTKNPWIYIYYYFKHWNIHLLSLCATFITQSRYIHLEKVVAFYYFLNCCILYIIHSVDKSIRQRMNRKIISQLLD